MEKIILFTLLSVVPSAIWCWLFIFLKDKRAVFVKNLFVFFLEGLGLAGAFVAIEMFLGKGLIFIFSKVFNVFSVSLEEIFGSIQGSVLTSLIYSFLIAYFEINVISFFLGKQLGNKKDVNKVIIGTQLSVVFALGFSVVKNAFSLARASSTSGINNLFIFQSLIIGLAYVLSIGVLAHFLTMSKFHKLYSEFFVKRGVLISFLSLGLFGFLLSAPVFYFTFWVAIIGMGVLTKCLFERRDFEIKLISREEVVPPIFNDRKEIITYLFNEQLSFNQMKSMAFCPNCFVAKKAEWKVCPFCAMKFK